MEIATRESFWEFVLIDIKTGEFFHPWFLNNEGYYSSIGWIFDAMMMTIFSILIIAMISVILSTRDTFGERVKSLFIGSIGLATSYLIVRSITSFLSLLYRYNDDWGESQIIFWLIIIGIILGIILLLFLIIPSNDLTETYKTFLNNTCEIVHVTTIREHTSSPHTVPEHTRALIVSDGDTYAYADVEISVSKWKPKMTIQIINIAKSKSGVFKITEYTVLD